jgi:hypothetical protein
MIQENTATQREFLNYPTKTDDYYSVYWQPNSDLRWVEFYKGMEGE